MEIEDEIMAGLRARYRRSLPDKLGRLRDLEARLAGGEDCLREIRSLAHKLVGSGASYGWTEISEAAAEVSRAADADVAQALAGLVTVVDRLVVDAPR